MELPILYEDADVVVVNKPAGLIVHSDGRTEEPTAEEWFRCTYNKADGGYAHRLDRDTSGVLIFAKTAIALEELRAAFTTHAVKKTYLAITYGAPKEKKGVIDFDIGRSRKDFRLRSAQPKAKGRLREALTRYEVVDERGEWALMKLFPETGRTHQLRVHLKAIHHPVAGDPLYAPKRGAYPGMAHLALHAWKIDFPLLSGSRAVVTAPPPEDLARALKHFSGFAPE